MQGKSAVAGSLRALRHQNDAGAEQHGEERDEFLVEEDMRDEPDGVFGGARRRYSRRVDIGRRDHGEGLDVHHQDPEQGKAAQNVERGDALGAADGGGANGGGRCRFERGGGAGHRRSPRLRDTELQFPCHA